MNSEPTKSNVREQQESPRVDVLILNFNGKRHLKICLDSVSKSAYPKFNIILIDNGSIDESIEFVRKRYPHVKIIENKENLGFARGYNHAIQATTAPYLVLLNNDVEVDKNWLKELIYPLTKPDTAATTSKLLFFHDRNKINACGGLIDKFGFGLNRGNGETDKGQYNKIEEVFYAVGAAMAIKRSVWNEVGPFDPSYFSYWEDVDWCWRARMMGYRILYIPTSVVYHKWRGSLRGARRAEQAYYVERHRLATILKNYSLPTLFSLMPRYLALEALKVLWILKNWTLQESSMVMKALIWNLTNLNDTLRKRYVVQQKRKFHDKEILKKMQNTSLELCSVTNSNSILSKHPFFKMS